MATARRSSDLTAEPVSNEGPKSGIRMSPVDPFHRVIEEIPAAPLSRRAAVKPRSERPAAPVVPIAPPSVKAQSSKAQYFRSLTTTREDWPILPDTTHPAVSTRTPTFGQRPKGAPDPTRFSLPAFKPPPAMALTKTPATPVRILQAVANDQRAVLTEEDFAFVRPRGSVLKSIFLMTIGIVAGVVGTLAAQSL